MPKLQALHDKYKDKGLVVIGVHDQDQHEKMEAFVKEKAITYPCVADPSGATAELYGVEGIPFAVVIDKAGKIRELNADDDEKTVPKLLDEKAP